MTTMFQPTQVTYDVEPGGASFVSALSNTQVWGPGQGYPYAWDRFLKPPAEQPGTWRIARFNWRTGGVVLQLGTNGNFGSEANVQAGWMRRRFRLDPGLHDLRITFRMGPVTERPDPRYANGQVFARLVPNIPFVPEKVATAQLPAGSVVSLDLSTGIPGNNYDLYVGCSNRITNPAKNPYCEVIIDDIKVRHTFSPYPNPVSDDEAERKVSKPIEAPDGVEIPSFDESLRFDPSELRCAPVEGEPVDDWIGIED